MAVREVDIGDGCKELEIPQEDLPQGHTIKDVMENTNPFSRDEIRYFDRKFDFACPEMPSSFHIRITFPRYRGRDIRSLASVRRTDKGSGSVSLILVVMVFGDGGRDVFARYVLEDLIKGPPKWEETRIFSEKLGWCLQEGLNPRLEFSATVLNCHVEKTKAKARVTPRSQDSSSKERHCVQTSS